MVLESLVFYDNNSLDAFKIIKMLFVKDILKEINHDKSYNRHLISLSDKQLDRLEKEISSLEAEQILIEFADGFTKESKLVNDLYLVDAIYQAFEYEKHYGDNFQFYIDTHYLKINNQGLKAFVKNYIFIRSIRLNGIDQSKFNFQILQVYV